MCEKVRNYLEQNQFEHFSEIKDSMLSLRNKNDFNLAPKELVAYGSFVQQMNFLTSLVSYQQGQEILHSKEDLIMVMANFLCFPQVGSDVGKLVSKCLRRIVGCQTSKNHKVIDTMMSILFGPHNINQAGLKQSTINVLNVLSEASVLNSVLQKIRQTLPSLLSAYKCEEDVKELIISKDAQAPVYL